MAQSVRLGPQDQFEYDARFGVLICRECQYAIQKSALESHFLRHKIYRDERQQLLSIIARFNILEPDQVALPPPTSPPVAALPIISGQCCDINGCSSFYASSKRMKRHRAEAHSLSEHSDLVTYARPVKLQTFFRGTKIRYFEVTPIAALSVPKGRTSKEKQTVSNKCHTGNRSRNPGDLENEHLDTSANGLARDFNLQDLACFHHFTTLTGLTLPCPISSAPSKSFWQSKVVSLALQKQWLMYGLLALSASHLAAVADDDNRGSVHWEQSLQYIAHFREGWEEISDVETCGNVEEEHMRIGCRIRRLLDLVSWGFDAEKSLGKEIAGTPRLEDFLGIICGLHIDDDNLDSGEACAFVQEHRGDDDESAAEITGPAVDMPFLMDRLHTLPNRITEVFGRPDNVRDVLATLSAISALMECCEKSFKSNGRPTTRTAMALWLAKLSDQFKLLLSRQLPAALVVVAYWTPLIDRATKCGNWYLKGSANFVLDRIRRSLPPSDRAVHNLLEDFVSGIYTN